MMPQEPRTYRAADVAVLLGVSEPTVRGLIRRGQLPVHRLGRRVFVFALDVERLIQRMRGPEGER
jgi:excisionase family DNA binding protein